MIDIDTSVGMKWFKAGERYEAEAKELRQRMNRQDVFVVANEILSLEIVRGLKNAQVRQPDLGITDTEIEKAFGAVEGMFRTGLLLECLVSDVKPLAKDIEMQLGLFMADALHLATAVYLRVECSLWMTTTS
jgi:predicted nucleic acid-binding protein